jgi:hypothetical protein
MPKKRPDVLEVLKTELNFLEMGGYSLGSWVSLGPEFIFEDSPTCISYDRTENPSPCTGCVLMQFVPPERRSERIPCRHIPLNASGATLDSMYRYSDRRSVEEAVGNWLRCSIDSLEEQRTASSSATGRAKFQKKPRHIQSDEQVAKGYAG